MIARLRTLLVREIGEREGSTRVAALLRIGLSLIVLSEFGRALILSNVLAPAHALLALSVFLSSLFLFAGLASRLAAAWSALSVLGIVYVMGEQRDFVHHHTHLLMLTLGLLALTPCGSSYSLDRHLALRKGRTPLERGAVWGQRLIAVNVSTVYLWGAYEKRFLAFVNGARFEQIYMSFFGGSTFPESSLFHPTMVALAWTTIALEIFLAIGLWFPRTRIPAIAIGIAFHLILYFTLPVSTFSALMILLYLAFLDPDRVHAWIDRMSGHAPGGQPSAVRAASTPGASVTPGPGWQPLDPR